MYACVSACVVYIVAVHAHGSAGKSVDVKEDDHVLLRKVSN